MYVRSSPYKYQKFKFLYKIHGLKCKKFPLDIDNCWNITYLKFQSTQKFEEVIGLYV